MGKEVETRLAGPEFFDCERLAARISARQCLLNQGKAGGLKVFGTRFMGKEARCLDCPEGRGMVAYPPGVFQPQPKPPLTPLYKRGEGEKEKGKGKEGVRAGTSEQNAPSPQPSPLAGEGIRTTGETPVPPGMPAPLTPAPAKKLPAWLKNASAAVRRDYLKEKGS
jgi:hypothetical protein